MRLSFLYLTLFAFLLGACSEPEPEVVVETGPAPPTAQEIAQEISDKLSLEGQLPKRGARMAKAATDEFLGILRNAKSANANEENGEQAMIFVTQKLEARIKQLEQGARWEHVLVHTDGYLVLNARSVKYDRLRRKAVNELNRPRVDLKGFHRDGNTGQTAAFIEIYVPLEKTTERHRARVGEEFNGLKVVEFIGDNQGITFEYMATGEIFDVLISGSRG